VSFDAPQADCPHDDRRRDARLSLVARATLFNEDGVGAPYRIDLRNISIRGCGFAVHGGAMQPGQRYRIKIEMGPMQFTSKLRVVSARSIGFGAHEVGAEFLRNELELSDTGTPANVPLRVERYARGVLRPAI